ncbi:MAG: methyltransferase domain-containing protein [Opitutaceae bacterium]|jgi:SAM-dependent methyltransferase
MTHEEKVSRWLREPGVEIGAFRTPIMGVNSVYIDRFKEYAGQPCLFDYLGDATQLPIKDNSINYVATSHVLEHVANPILALKEWCRVLRHGGIIYMVVPDKRFTWDRNRGTTSVAHMIEDYEKGTPVSDPTHIDDFVDNIVWSEFSPSTPPDRVQIERDAQKSGYWHAVNNKQEINIHFHVFDPESIKELVGTLRNYDPETFDWELVDFAERFPFSNPNGILCVIRVKKSFGQRLSHALARPFRRGSHWFVKKDAGTV